MDYILGGKGELFDGINLNLWVQYLDFLPVGKLPGNADQVRFFAEFDKKFDFNPDILSITPFIRFEVPFGLCSAEGLTGLRFYSGAKSSWKFAPNWFDDGACGMQSGTFFDCKVGLSWKITGWLTIEPLSYRVMTPLNTMNDGRELQKIVTSGLIANFKF
jgi:hypothetical protein